jgi:hypothetical protein
MAARIKTMIEFPRGLEYKLKMVSIRPRIKTRERLEPGIGPAPLAKIGIIVIG